MKTLLRENKALLIFLLLSVGFLILQCYLNFHEMITPDQFWLVNSFYHKYRTLIPYRDFMPYKSVLGNYLLMIPLFFIHDPFYLFVYIKNLVSVYNAIFLLICSLWLTRFYSFNAVFISVLLLVSATFFLTVSNDIRVDILAYWLCLISAFLLLENKFVKAGLVLGIAFCISQKALWYVCASDVALLAVWFFSSRKSSTVRDVFVFNVVIVSVIAIYIGFWALFSNSHTVLTSLFYDARLVYNMNVYASSNLMMLGAILKEDNLYLTLWILSFVSIFIVANPLEQKKRIFVLTYASTILLLLVVYKQPFGYFTVALIPALFLLYADFFQWLADLSKYPLQFYINFRAWILLLLICTLLYLFLLIVFPYFPYAYWLVLSLPLLLGLYVFTIKNNTASAWRVLACLYFFIFCGIVLSARDMLPFPPKNGYRYDRELINLVHGLVQDGSTYVAGIDLLYDKKQLISGNSFLEQNILYLTQPNEELKKTLLPSLDLDPTITVDKIIKRIQAEPVKLFVHTKFIDRVPGLLAYLKAHYEYMWGGVYIYSPQIAAGKQLVTLKFTGRYQIESELPVMINNNSVAPRAMILLKQKYFQSVAKSSYRMKLIPDKLPKLSRQFNSDLPARLMCECKYFYIKGKRFCLYIS